MTGVESATVAIDRAPGRVERSREATATHTRILRLALGVEESRAYWEHVDPTVPVGDRALQAFEQRWFGSKSLDRARFLLAAFSERFDAFPSAFAVLQRWRSMDTSTRQVVCHWHLQLSDPIYRRFTGDFLVARRGMHDPKVSRDVVLRWVKGEFPGRWSEATSVQFASKLLSAALEAGLVGKRDARVGHALVFPKVTDHALAYLLYLLRGTDFVGSLTENPYLGSVGIDADMLAARGRTLPGVTLRRMMQLAEFDWVYPDLGAWAREVVS